MARPCFSDTLAYMAAPLLGDLLCFFCFLSSHPLHLAYIFFFSPYLLAALSFLGPLLFSTCFLLLALLTVSPYLREAPTSLSPLPDGGHSPTGQFSNTLRLVLDMLDPCEDGNPEVSPPGPLSGIALELQACVESVEEMYKERGEGMAGANLGSPGDGVEEEEEEKRIVTETLSSNELFGWELEAISKLYKALTYEVEEFPIKLAALRSFKEGDLLSPGTGIHVGDRKQQTGDIEADLPRKEVLPRPVFESLDCKTPICDADEDVDILLGNASKSAIQSRDCGLPGRRAAPADCFTGADSSVSLKIATIPKSKGVSRSDSDGFKLLRRSSSSSSSSAFGAPGGGLSRVASSGEWRWGGSNRVPPLSSSGSMRKEKEWRRTLACKLYEERMVADGGEEGMDLLWETYELGSGKEGAKNGDSKAGKGTHSDEKGGKESKKKVANKKGEHAGAEEEEEEEEGEEDMVGKLCCLQALRFSTAKMGFGMGRSGLVKVSKAMKGVGVFRRALRSSRKGKE